MVDVKSDPDGDAFASLYDDLDAPPLTVPPTPDEVKPVLPPSPRGSARKASGSPSVSRKASTSKPATAPATPSGNGGGSPDEDEPKPLSIAHLPEATKEALKTFIRLEQNTYQNKSLGLSKQQEDSMICDCSYRPDRGDDPGRACGPDSSCINRELMIECLEGECKCGHHCQNQRFQQAEYAPIAIVQTEKKGFGVRASADLPADTLVYEYIGEVIGHNTFVRRMADYYDEGIVHFYFMALGREEFIDATKKGNLGRFLNHSCRPNCKVEKWLVGRKVRMGIFTKRDVAAGEELTFNYNVDRYGHDAQECFCGESNCVGYIGGKQQTDIAGMDDLFLDALGISEEINQLGLKGNKKKKGRKLDVDYVPIMKAIQMDEVVRVGAALRQAVSNRRILVRLLARVRMTEDSAVQGELMRRHGFSIMANVLSEYAEDGPILATTLEILLTWPVITRNKLQTTNIEDLIVELAKGEDQIVKPLAQTIIDRWLDLKLGYRIPKAVRDEIDVTRVKRNADMDAGGFFKRQRVEPSITLDDEDAAPRFVPLAATEVKEERKDEGKKAGPDVLPPNWRAHKTPDGKTYYSHIQTKQVVWTAPTEETSIKLVADFKAANNDVDSVVTRMRKELAEQKRIEDAAAAAKLAAEEAERKREKELRRKERKDKARRDERERKAKSAKAKGKARATTSSSSKAAKPAVDKDKAMLRQFSTVVVNTMSRYKAHFEPEKFKQRAKEATQICCDKEKKSRHYATETYTGPLATKKESQIRDFVKTFVGKLLARKGIDISAISSKPPTPSKPVASVASTSATPIADDDLVSPAFESIGADGDALMAEINGDEEAAAEESDGDSSDDGGGDADATPSDGKASSLPAIASAVPVADPTAVLCSRSPSPPPPETPAPPEASSSHQALETSVEVHVSGALHDLDGQLVAE